ncbi:MAG: hypothetical protein AB1646_26505, partial [Thermodesulfobacteriota bacterium]
TGNAPELTPDEVVDGLADALGGGTFGRAVQELAKTVVGQAGISFPGGGGAKAAARAASGRVGGTIASFNRWGSRGDPGHQRTIREGMEYLEKKYGYKPKKGGSHPDGRPREEQYVKTTDGYKSTRKPDAIMETPDGRVVYGQAIRVGPNGYIRPEELRAVEDLRRTGNQVIIWPIFK